MKSIIVNGKKILLMKAFENTNEIIIPMQLTQEDFDLFDLYFNYEIVKIMHIEDLKKICHMLTYFDKNYDDYNE